MSLKTVLKPSFKFELNKNATHSNAFAYILCGTASQRAQSLKQVVAAHSGLLTTAQQQNILKSDKKQIAFTSGEQHVWILQGKEVVKGQHQGLLDESTYSWFRDQAASLYTQMKAVGFNEFHLQLRDADDSVLQALVVGFELISYQFLSHFKGAALPEWSVTVQSLKKGKAVKVSALTIEHAQLEATSVQLARHLVNLPPNEANPETIQNFLTTDIQWPKSTVKVNVWDQKKLKSEGMNLLLAVGQGSSTPSRMIHIQYRPKTKSSKKPVAFVGKGITFDTGGLDIKPSSAMRLMKKDMGGAAAVIGLAYWVAHSNCKHACDFYLALAENSIDAHSMRPSDVYKSRAGYFVEIDNTDAEGRLVLADAMDVAAKRTGADEPEILIDLATLTGAIKVALGADMAGLFSNDDQLANELVRAGQQIGEPNWRMPLVQKYFGSMSSNFADFKNSADGFGGAITAALFLEKFCNGKKWAHLDIYAWTDKAQGPYAAAGGNGQPVQTLVQWLKQRK